MTDILDRSSSSDRQPRSSGIVWTRSGILLGFLVAFLLAPKIDIISVLRIEDFVFLGVLPFILWRYAPQHTFIPKFLNWYFAYLAIATFSALINVNNLGLFGLINVARQLQYLIWFVVGAQMAAVIPEKRFQDAMTFVAIILIIWGLGELSGIIPKMGKFTGATNRITLNTSGPYESSVIILFLMLFVRKKFILFSLFGILLLTQSRITLAAGIATYLILYPRLAFKFGIPTILLSIILLIANPDFIANARLAETMAPGAMWSALSAGITDAPVITTLSDYRYYAFDTLWEQVGENGNGAVSDISFEIRVVRWALILTSISQDIVKFLFGWGPGAWGAAVDSHYIRYLGEIGVVGTTFFVIFAVGSISSPLMSYRAAMLILLFCSVFIDILTASKAMSFLWAILGYTYARSKQNR